MLHKYRVLQALKGNAMRQTRILLGIKPRPKAPVLSRPIAEIVGYHSVICQRLVDLWATGVDIAGQSVCEIGPGDCMASAAFFAAKGASHVDLVELQPPVANEKQLHVLQALKKKSFPISLEVIHATPKPALNDKLVSYHKQSMEDYRVENRHDFIFSHNVMEHIENLEAVFAAAQRSLRPGGRMFHVIDLGGHGQFEDPLPPLDFQTYPDWLYNWMFPPYHRATRRFAEEYRESARAVGFQDVQIIPLRLADTAYFDTIHKKLRTAARVRPRQELQIIEFLLKAVK